MKHILPVFILLMISAISCSSAGLRGALSNDGVHHIRNYTFNPSSDLPSRIVPIPSAYLDILKKFDGRSDYESYKISGQELSMFKEYLGYLPQLNRKTMQQKTVAVYFIKNFAGAGMADYVLGDNNDLYTILIVNPDVMKKTISQWQIYREQGSFVKTEAGMRLDIDCGARYTALLYLLIHESSHIVDYVHNATPYVEPNTAELFGNKKDSRDFVGGVWDDYARPIEKYEVKNTDKLSPYGLSPAVLPDTDMVKLYENLKKTPFVSLYGSRIWAEDFAESSTFYFLTQIMKQPYKISMYEKDKKILEYSPEENPLVSARWKQLQFLYAK